MTLVIVAFSAAIDEIFTIDEPSCFDSSCPRTMHGRTVPIKLTFITPDTASIGTSKKDPSGGIVAPGMFPPAALTRTLIFPHLETVSSRSFSISPLFVTSAAIPTALPPSWRILAATSSHSACRLPVITTHAPRFASPRAMHCPSTPHEPVTTTTLSPTSNRSITNQKILSKTYLLSLYIYARAFASLSLLHQFRRYSKLFAETLVY
mmetsp:Transcript_25893/g.56265  ORF Transcript_25893/g.56265 Transcript_25893/m.56265 type:complete len:207 (-) Transcript_25893:21-641(-)